MFNFGPSPDVLRQLGIMPQMGMDQNMGAPMQGQVPSMGGAMPGLDMPLPTFMQQFQRQPQQQSPSIPTNGPGGMQNASAPPKQGLFSRMMGNMRDGMAGKPQADNGKKMGAGGKMTGMLAGQAPMFGNMLLDDEERQKQALRSF